MFNILPDFSTRSAPRIAIIGCGAIAEWFYLPALRRHPPVMKKLILVDRDGARAKKLASQFKIQNYTVNYQAVIDQVEGAVIAVPTPLHYPVAMAFLARGIPVLCEKPLAGTAIQAREMVELAHSTGTALATNYALRLYASYLKVKELLANREMGAPLFIDYSLGEEFRWPTVSGFYFKAATSASGVLSDRGSHIFDLICWWLGAKPDLISCQNDSFGGIDAVTEVKFGYQHCLGRVKLSWLGKSPCWYSVECEEGKIEGDIYDFQHVILTSKSGQKRKEHLKTAEKDHKDFGHKQIDNFINILSNSEKPLVSGSDVLASVEFIDECYERATQFDMPWYESLVSCHEK